MSNGLELARRRKTLQKYGPASLWSQHAIADRLGVSVDTIKRLERDQNVRLRTYRALQDEITRGERLALRRSRESSIDQELETARYALPENIKAAIREIAERLVELAERLEQSDRAAQPPAPRPRAPHRRRR